MGGPAWLLDVVWPGPLAVLRDEDRAHLLGLRGRTRPLRLRLLHGHWKGARGGVPEGERGRVGALHGDQV